MRKKIFLLVALFACFAFAQEQMLSKKELYARARDALKTALEKGNKERAKQALGYLKENVENGAPLTRFEEYLVDMELGDYESAILIYVDLRRIVLDQDYKPKEEVRLVADDLLASYLRRDLDPFTMAKADSLYALVENSNVKAENKKLYRALLYSELMFADLASGDAFLAAAKDYTMYNPISPYTEFLKNDIIPYVDNFWKRIRDFMEDPLKHKYYTGGLGAHIYIWSGFLSGGVTEYLDDKMGDSFMADATLRIGRVSLNAFFSFGLITLPNDYRWDESEDESVGYTIGFMVYDSRFLRVEPFLGFGFTTYMCVNDADESFDYILGNNVDFRLYASKPSRIGVVAFTVDLRFKYMVQLGNYDTDHIDGDEVGAIRHTFAFGLGVEWW